MPKANGKLLNRPLVTKRRKWRWVTFNSQTVYVRVWPGAKEPEYGAGPYMKFFGQSENESVPICPDEFHRLFGFCPKSGECLKVEFQAKVVW